MFWSDEESKVRSHLAPIEPELNQIIDQAWMRLKSIKEHELFIFSRSYPTIFHDLVTQEALLALQMHRGIKAIGVHDSYFFVVDQRVALRFKKGNATGLSSNYPTQRAQSLQKGQLDLPGIVSPVHVEVVYQPDPMWTKIENVLIVRRYGNTMLWQYTPSTEVLPEPINIPIPQTHSGREAADLNANLIVRRKNKDSE